MKFSFKDIKIIPLTYIAFVLCTTGLPLYLGGYVFMKKIPLTQGKFALVDDEDYEYLIQWSWNASKGKRVIYAVGNVNGVNKRMHRVIMDAQLGQVIDHKDSNGLNNQKSNLRFCTNAENAWNRRPYGKYSKYKGVSFEKRPTGLTYWTAQITLPTTGKKKKIGRFKTEIEAAIARDRVSVQVHGEFAFLNFPSELNKRIEELKNDK